MPLSKHASLTPHHNDNQPSPRDGQDDMRPHGMKQIININLFWIIFAAVFGLLAYSVVILSL